MGELRFANVSQRVVHTFRAALAEPVYAAGVSVESQRALHAFYTELYTRLAEQPELFGLPGGADDSLAEVEPNMKDRKQEVKRKLDKPRGVILAGLDYLMQAGCQGRLEGETLVVENYAALLKQTKISKKFLKGLETLGLEARLAPGGEQAALHSPHFAGMFPALIALAAGCARFDPPGVGQFQFARCDFRAIHGEEPCSADLYRMFAGQDQEVALRLHAYFSQHKYKEILSVNSQLFWSIEYQGDRKIKASPLYQVIYDDRHAYPMRMQIKCASTGRIAALLPKQSERLQADFQGRIYECRGDDCGWCRNKKTLGPSLVEYKGEARTACWYSNPEVHEIDGSTVELIQEYEQMHAGLAPVK